MAQVISVRLSKGDAPSLGFRLQGGKDFGTPLVVQKVNLGSPAEKAGLLAGDSVIKINATEVYNLRHKDAQDVIIRAGPSFEITVHRGGTTWKPSVTPLPKAATNNYSTVTKTSLAAKPQSSIGSIGTGHNLSAKPFSPQLNGAVNGGPKLVNKQYNTPVGLYSEESIAETLSAQAEVLSTGVLGVNFKKNEKSYDASNSAVFRMVQEADKEPRDQEAEPDSGVVSAPLGTGGLKHVQAPETKPVSTAPQLPPGQNICAECERLIVGVFVRIKDKNLHVECFKCATCGSSLKNVGYYNINQKLYCDIHAKLAAKSNPPAPNLIPVTVPPGAKAPAGTITAALASHTLPTPAPVSPGVASSNITAQPFQSGSSFSSPRPFSSVSAPLSPPGSAYSTLPKSFSPAQPHSSPAPSSVSLCKQSTKNSVDISKPIEIVSELKDQEDSDNDCVLDLLKSADMLTLDNPCDLSNPITLTPEQISSESVIVKPEKLLRDLEKATISCMPCADSDTNTKSSTNNISIHSNLKICCVCNTEIQRGPFITALGKIWCPEHFICNTPSCRRPLQDLGFVEEQGQLYCEYCFEQYIAPPCAKCGSKIKGDCLKAIGKNFHPECFSCSYCGKLFGNSPFFLEDGLPYCDNDWNELFTTKCFACGFPVEAGDRWVEALNNNYHSQCFNCTMCKKNLEGQSFFAKGGRPFCKNHAR